MKIIIWTGSAYEDWGESSIFNGGIGGSETAAIHMARELANRGHEVEMFGEHTGFEGWSPSGVFYRHYEDAMKAPELLTCDVLISSRDKRIHRLSPNARLTVLWVHDIHVGDDWENEVPKFDLIFCLSQWAKKTFRGYYPLVPDDKVIVSRNGIYPSLFTDYVPHARRGVNPRFTYSSSPDRGLDVLVSMWADIREAFGDEPELHVYYGFDNWEKMARSGPGKAKVEYMKSLVCNQEHKGIFYHGRQPQHVVARSHRQSQIWFYPTDFKETYCITALEAQAAGCYVVSSDLAALSETIKFGHKIRPRNTDLEYKNTALQSLSWAHLSANREEVERTAMLGREWALTQTWEALAADWSEMFAQRLSS